MIKKAMKGKYNIRLPLGFRWEEQGVFVLPVWLDPDSKGFHWKDSWRPVLHAMAAANPDALVMAVLPNGEWIGFVDITDLVNPSTPSSFSTSEEIGRAFDQLMAEGKIRVTGFKDGKPLYAAVYPDGDRGSQRCVKGAP